MTKAVYEEEYFVGDRSPIIFGYASIFYRANAWYRFQRVAALIKKHGGKGRVLDVGCALGHSVKRFRKIGLKPVGCDISAYATSKAKEMNPCTGIVRADALFLPFRSKMFDVTTAFETLEHCSDLDLALNEVRRVTKRHGLVVVSVPTTDLNATYEDKSHVWHMSLREWMNLFRGHFRVLSVEYFMKFMKYVDGKTCNTFIALRNKNA
jgi:ubiquinone/menaquinone biosynthesis C-methylase UbiE